MKTFGTSFVNESKRDLFHEEERDAFKHLIAVESRDGHVEEETVEDGRRNVGQRVRQQKER